MWLIDQLAEQRIREAQAQGAFDELPGAGEPLQLDDDTAVAPELRAAYRLLKNAGYLPPEVELRGEIAQSERLLALAEQPEDRAQHLRRLRYLMTCLNQSRRVPLSLQTEQAYFERLCEKISEKANEGLR